MMICSCNIQKTTTYVRISCWKISIGYNKFPDFGRGSNHHIDLGKIIDHPFFVPIQVIKFIEIFSLIDTFLHIAVNAQDDEALVSAVRETSPAIKAGTFHFTRGDSQAPQRAA